MQRLVYRDRPAHLIADTRRPLCQATAFFQDKGDTFLGGFDMPEFEPKFKVVEDIDICKRCLKKVEMGKAILKPDGTYVVNDVWFMSLSNEFKEEMKEWYKLSVEADTTQFYKNWEKAKAKLKGRAWRTVDSWFRQAKVKYKH